MKKRWLVATLLVGVLALGITGGAVLAQDSATGANSPVKTFAARVAAILGLDEAKVQDAFKQAGREMEDEALQAKLDKMVEEGRMTQAQADQYKQWYQSRPEALAPGFPLGGRGFHDRGGMRGGHGMMGPGWYGMGKLPGAVPTPTPGSSTTATSF